MSFYGFDWQNSPKFSRLFTPEVFSRAQQAYGQGMGQFTPYDQEQLQKIKDEQAARMAQSKPAPTPVKSNFIVGADGRMYENDPNILRQYITNNNYGEKEIQGKGLQGLNYHAYQEASNKGNDELMKFLYGYGFKPLAGA